ncbi:MAG TPA: hypothetical protein VK922_11095 [Gemmatimonadaceae bacterium]|nr:hypothetical protein [Gemmatimonadaceae bacterium]
MARITRSVIAATAALAMYTSPAFAVIYQHNTAGPACGSGGDSWNARGGDIILHRAAPSGGGPVSAIIRSIGERFTHNALVYNHERALHATMRSPPVCVNILLQRYMCDEVQNGWPGVSAPYSEGYHIASTDAGTGRQYKSPSNPAAASGVVSFWGQQYGTCSTSKADSNLCLFRFYKPGTSSTYPYVMYQFMDLESAHLSASHRRNGLVCSTWMAHALNRAGYGTIEPYVYSLAQKQASIDNTGPAIYNDCKSAGQSDSTCKRIRNQVLNAFAADKGKEWSDSPWRNVYGSAQQPRSISPDRLAGLGVHADAHTPWGGGESGLQTLSFSGSQYYSCWY